MKLHLRHILVEQNYEAEDVLRKLQEGADFAELARKFSKCSSGPHGGELGRIDLRRVHPSFAEAAEVLKPGERTGPVRSPVGVHIIERHPEKPSDKN